MAANDEFSLPDELPETERKKKATYLCPICPFESTDENELQHHSNEHLDKEEHDKLEENDGSAQKRQRNGGVKSNVPFLEDNVKYQGYPVKFKRVILTGLVDTAKKNLYEVRTKKTRVKWNKGCFNEWLYKNVPDSKRYTKETLKKRVHQVEKEAEKFIMTKKESSATGIGKMSKKIDPKLHSERKETFTEPTTEEEKEMAELGSEFARLKKEIDEFEIPPKQNKVNPVLEAKARHLSGMLEDVEDNNEDNAEVEDEDEDITGKRKIRRGTLKGMPYDMYEKSQEHRINSVQNFYENRKQRKDSTKQAKNGNNDDLESMVFNLCKTAQDTVTKKHQDPQPQPQPAPQPTFSPYMPYGYPYPGLMGAPLPLMQPMGMPSLPMFSSPMQPMGIAPPSMFNPPMAFKPANNPEQKKSAKSGSEGFSMESAPSKIRISKSGVARRSSTEHAPAQARGPSSERDSETDRDSMIEDTEPSSPGLDPQKRRTSVIGQAKSGAEGFSMESSPSKTRISMSGVARRSSSEHAPAKARASLTGEGGPSSEQDSETDRDSVIEDKERCSPALTTQNRRTSVIGQTGKPSHDAKVTAAVGRQSVISASVQSSERAPVEITSTVGGRKLKQHPSAAPPPSTVGPAPMAYGVPDLYTRMAQQSQADQMVYSHMTPAQAGGSYPQMSPQLMPQQMRASPISQQEMAALMAQQHLAQQQMAQQHLAQQQMAQHQGYPQMAQQQGYPQMAQQQGYPQMAQQQGYPQMAQHQGYPQMAQHQGYPQMFQRSPSPMMSQPPNSSQPNGMGPRPSKNRGNKKPSSTKASNVFNEDEDY